MTKSNHSFKPQQFLAPRFWPTWLGIGLLRLMALLPYPLQLTLGRGLGNLMYLLLPSRRKITLTNLRLCFPEMSDTERKQLTKQNFQSVGITVFESVMTWWASNKRLAPLCHVEGLEHLQQALRQGKGVILLSAHMTCLEIGCRLLLLHQPFYVMYKQQKNPLFEALLKRVREAHATRAIQRHDVRGFIKALKDKEACWYAPDQDFGRKNALFVPFFGTQAATITATSRFAEMSGAVVVPFFPRRRHDGSGYDLTILPALENFPSGDDYQDTLRINRIIEEQIRKAPEQYLWVHRRFKTRPEGEEDVYQ